MTKIFAQESIGRIGEGEGLGVLNNLSSASEGLKAISRIVSSIVGIMTIAGGIWFLFQFVIGGFNWITSGGDKAKLQSARDRITNAFIGLVVVAAGAAILALAGTFFGFDFTLSNPDIIDRLTPTL